MESHRMRLDWQLVSLSITTVFNRFNHRIHSEKPRYGDIRNLVIYLCELETSCTQQLMIYDTLLE